MRAYRIYILGLKRPQPGRINSNAAMALSVVMLMLGCDTEITANKKPRQQGLTGLGEVTR